MAWNIGANDVANAMGTSVGSKALTLKKAVFIAAILEFAGAFFAGGDVAETIQKGIISPGHITDPTLFVLGMMGSLLATGVLLQIASTFGLPVSTTHAIVGAVMGFGIAVGGFEAVSWGEMGWIAASWVLSPILSGIVAYFIFLLIQKQILFALNPIEATQRLAPFFVFLCANLLILSLAYHGLAPLHLDLPFPIAFTISLTISASLALFCHFQLKKPSFLSALPAPSSNSFHFSTQAYFGVEKIFVFLQIMSASLVAFAHGANDVANAIGPVAAVLSVLKTNTLSLQTQIPSWLLALGGAGIVIGLATWGWRVIETIGKKITELSPTRGFAAEFGAAITILLASKLGFPISTTHALVGAVFGVGMARGLRALNLKTLKEILLSWIITIPFCAILSIAMFYLLKLGYFAIAK